jgi:hypothetical protein
MTDQLETDLRTMLATRASEVTADIDAGHAAIAARLQSGDAALADVVPTAEAKRFGLRPSGRRPFLLAAAAVVVLVLVAVAITLANDQTTVDTTPSEPPAIPAAAIFVGEGAPDEVVADYLVDRLDVDPAQLTVSAGSTAGLGGDRYVWTRSDVDTRSGGVVVVEPTDDDRWTIVESYADGASLDEVTRTGETITVRSTGPAGSYLSLSVHRMDGTALTAGGCGGEAVATDGSRLVDTEPVGCELVDEPIGAAAVTVRLSIVTAEGVALTLEEQLVESAGD